VIEELAQAFKTPNYKRQSSEEIHKLDCPQKIKIMKQYLFPLNDRCLHIRRTLDQFYYSTLPGVDARTSDQVVYRFAEKQRKKLEADMETKKHEEVEVQNAKSKLEGMAQKAQAEEERKSQDELRELEQVEESRVFDPLDVLEKGPQITITPIKPNTLHQSRGLGNDIVEGPSVVEKVEKEKVPDELKLWQKPKILMVNQLWMWVIDGGKISSRHILDGTTIDENSDTVITSFPAKSKSSLDDGKGSSTESVFSELDCVDASDYTEGDRLYDSTDI
jgi:hypothetical protein